MEAIADLLNLSLNSNRTLIDELGGSLRDKKSLLILDNFEHVIQFAPDISKLLRQTNHLKIVVTSREPLNVQGETVFALDGLDIQIDKHDLLEESGAYQLYVERAKKTYPEFEPDKDDKLAIASICKLLGGMPLAIELAAAWANVLSPQKTYQELLHDMDLLVASDQDRPQRHQSVRATFEYSWHLLESESQAVLLKLGIFHREGFTYQAAEIISGATPQIIKALVDAGILQRKNQRKFVFHPLIYQFVSERLQADKARHLELQENHLSFYHHYVVNLIKMVRDNLDIKIIRDFEDEAYNLNQAWSFALKTEQYDVLETSVEIGYVCEIANFWNECDTQFRVTERLLPEGLPLLRGRMLAFRSIFAFRLLDYETHTRLAYESWKLLKESPYIGDAALALSFQAIGLCFQKQYDAALHLVDQIETVLYRDDIELSPYARLCIQYTRPAVALFSGKPEEALPLLKALPRIRWLYLSNYLAECYIELGMNAEATRELELNYETSMRVKNYRTALPSALHLSYISHNDVHARYRDVMSAFTEIAYLHKSPLLIANSIHLLGQYCVLRGFIDRAKLVFSVNAKMLYQQGYIRQMMQNLLNVAQLFRLISPKLATVILSGLQHDNRSPIEIQQQAQRLLDHFELESQPSVRKLEDIILYFFESDA